MPVCLIGLALQLEQLQIGNEIEFEFDSAKNKHKLPILILKEEMGQEARDARHTVRSTSERANRSLSGLPFFSRSRRGRLFF